LLVPADVKTVTLREPTAAAGLIVNVVVINDELTTVTGPTVTSALLIETVAPAIKLVPVSDTPTTAPCVPDAGSMNDSIGVAATTENAAAPLFPAGVETVTLRAPTTAVELIVNVVVRDVGPTTVTGPTVTSALLTETVAPATKPVPVSVTPTVVPCTPEAGLIDDSVGGARTTVKVTALLVPPTVETVTLRGPGVAVASIVNVAPRSTELEERPGTTVMPPPLTAIVVAPGTKFVPVRATFTNAP
jgi:hypothetical protein